MPVIRLAEVSREPIVGVAVGVVVGFGWCGAVRWGLFPSPKQTGQKRNKEGEDVEVR
jgi:hypothetical protein